MRAPVLGLLTALALGCRAEPEPPPSTAAAPAPDFEAALQVTPRLDGDAVVVDVALEEGYHLYAPGEATGRPIAIVLNEGAWTAGEPDYPAGERKTTPLGPSVVIEGEARARLPVRSTEDDPGPVQGGFLYQVCTDTACDRPRKLPFSLEPRDD